MTADKIDFRKIRTYSGRQDRAFEELCYQLLADGVESPDILTRTGDPDAGLEWYITRPDGTVDGWQAKYIFDVDPLLTAMTGSLKTVLEKRQEVSSLTFVIPWNLPEGRQEGSYKSAREKYEDKVEAWKRDIAGADSLSIVLKTESDLVGLLAQERHRGRRYFFWSENQLSTAALEQLHREAAEIAGPRYRPDLQVDVPIQEDLDSLGLSNGFKSEVDSQLEYLAKDLRGLQPLDGDLADLSAAAIESARGLLEASVDWYGKVAEIPARLDRLSTAAHKAWAAQDELLDKARSLDDEARKTNNHKPSTSSHGSPRQSAAESSHGIRNLVSAIRELANLTNDRRAELFAGRPYFLTGDAGAGKTHLFLDSVGRALREGRPAAVLLGEQLTSGQPWPQLASCLGLPPDMPKAELLGVLEACGALGEDARFLLCIDALNETQPPAFWATALPQLAAAVDELPHVALAVSVRSTYVDQVDPEQRREQRFVVRSHPGLRGREIEATQRFFDHFGIEAPRHPLLRPEFTNPLFLLLYCESFEDGDVPPGSEGRVAVFDRLLRTRVVKVARRLADHGSAAEVAALESETRKVLDAVVDELVVGGEGHLPLRIAVELARSAAESPTLGRQILSRLEAEGVFTKAPVWIDHDTREDGLRVSFQAFADHLLLKRRLAQSVFERPTQDHDFVLWLANASWGVREAAAVVIPERYSLELRDLFESVDLDAYRDLSDNLLDHADKLTLDTLAYRDTGSATGATVDAINRYLQGPYSDATVFFDRMCLVAPLPRHPLNARRLHANLARMSLPDRDAFFGTAVYDALDDEEAIGRLARWANDGPYPDYESEVVELAAMPLLWLLGSPNRYMRDWLTKVLVRLFAGHKDVLERLTQQFATCGDPYVVERLAAIVYGVLMRSTQPVDMTADEGLVRTTCKALLTNPLPNALLLDHLEGIAEWGVVRGLVDGDDLPRWQGPYGFPRPDNPWTQERIDELYAYDAKPDDQEFWYGSIYMSLFNLGDFGRYEVDRCFERFSRIPLSEPAPSERPRSSQRLVKARWRELLDRRGDDAVANLTKRLDEGASFLDLEGDDLNLLREVQACYETIQPKPIEYPSERARRWIFMKTIKLGWTPERFGRFERWRTRESGRSASKPERFGKKYQWIAYQELLARVRDHYHPMPSWAEDEDSEFPGLWATYDRDIDPSVPPIGRFEELRHDHAYDLSLQPHFPVDLIDDPLADSNLERYLGQGPDPLTDYSTYPKATRVLDQWVAGSSDWMALDAYSVSQITDEDHEYGMKMDQATLVSSWLVSSSESLNVGPVLLAYGTRLDGDPYGTLFDRHGHTDCCYAGEIGWRDQGCYHRRLDPISATDGSSTVPIMPTIEGYVWESGRFDCSIAGSTYVSLPSAALAQLTDLRWGGDDSWSDQTGDVVMANAGRRGFREAHSVLVRRDWLKRLLAEHELSLVVRCWTERRDFRAGRGQRPFYEMSSVAVLDAALDVVFEDEVSGPHS